MTESKRSKGFRFWAGAAVLAVATVIVMSTGGGEGDGEIVYSFAEVDRGEVVRRVAASGTLSALVTVEVGSQLSGQITEIHVDFNSDVRQGDLIALIDPQTFAARVEQSRAETEVARANLSVQRAARLAEEATVTEARRDFERKEPLAADGIVSGAELDRAQAALDTALARLEMAAAQVENAEATVRQREATLNQARIDLERTEIRAPVDGTVIERNVDIGQTVAASFSAPVLFRIARDLTEMQVEAQVDEADIGEVRESARATFTVDAYPDREFDGRVRQVRKSPTIIDNVVTYVVVISARNNDQRLLPGMTANVAIITGQRDDVLRVPNSALRFRPLNAEATAPGAGGANAREGRGSGGGGAGGMLARLTEQLELSDDQQAALRDGFQDIRRNAFSGGGGGDPEAAREAFRTGLDRMLGDILTPEQMRKYRQLAAGRQQIRQGQVWRLDGGDPEAQPLRLGISDDSYTEVIGDGLREGDEIISGARRPASGS